MKEKTMREVEAVMKRGKSHGVSDVVILARAIYELSKDIEYLSKASRDIPHRIGIS